MEFVDAREDGVYVGTGQMRPKQKIADCNPILFFSYHDSMILPMLSVLLVHLRSNKRE